MSALELCPDFDRHLLRMESLSLLRVELVLFLFVVRKTEFLEDDLGVNQTQKIDFQKRFPEIPMYSMCQESSVCRGSARNENLESLQADWKRKTILLVDELVLLEINLSVLCVL